MNIKDVEFKNIFFLAPMAGVCDRAFRELCVRFGAAYTVSEMVSAKGFTMNDKKSAGLLYLSPEERPSGAQIFGTEPEIMALAAERIEKEFRPEIIDINMGCPAPKVAGNGAGAALMKNPQLCYEITKAVSETVKIPVTVKIRKGWDNECLSALEVARLCEKGGAAAVAVHGRTRQEMYSGKADLEIIKQIKSALDIPVIGNGDVTDEQSAARMLEYTNCDAVMIGRGALGNPWIFQRLCAYFSECRVIPEPSAAQKTAVMLSHIEKLIEYKGEYTGMREARRHAAYYTKGMRDGAQFRKEIGTFEHFEQLCELAFRIVKENE